MTNDDPVNPLPSEPDPPAPDPPPRTPPMTPGVLGAVTHSSEPDDPVNLDSLEQRLLAEYLAERTAVCPVCQYELHGVVGGRCPECGVPIELQVASPQRRLGPWLFGLLSVAMVAGFFTVAGIITAFMALKHGMPWQDEESVMLVLLWIGAALYDAGVYRIVHRRAAFWKKSVDTQNRLAAIYAACSIIPAILYLAILFNM